MNRWANILVAFITIAFVVGGGATYPYYLFIAAVEVVCLLIIIWRAWRWSNPEPTVVLPAVALPLQRSARVQAVR